ncbi:hypothetical protein [Haloarcula sp. 1CSR25-25]|uniref:DUF5789 family protein n=1 Tax=Haloarcula sp. 1CSR25-25 TaxID=2862545 RepID=UPI00289583D8|nr:hypothetical protein [Haloarcula sp. 1CSR25-25]MDT3435381.1 hypothetical protein [Haloarcula sp. 1CSR25-25]
MEYSDTKQVVDESFEFPVTHTAVVEQIGTTEITSPSGDSITIQEVLAQVEEESYPSSDALYTTIIGNLDETFIGRKYYDDRGGTSPGTEVEDDATVSL